MEKPENPKLRKVIKEKGGIITEEIVDLNATPVENAVLYALSFFLVPTFCPDAGKRRIAQLLIDRVVKSIEESMGEIDEEE